ncbi:MAG: hypothetical protein KDD32_03550 [Bacteroidetes bacterium]|nr:hypothetical protein [Bacteroidota bacterium]
MMSRANKLLSIFLLTVVLFGCNKNDCLEQYASEFYKPIYTSWEAIKDSIGSEAPRDIKAPGKMFALGSFLFINEVNEGIHVIDNSNPYDPQNIQFIRIPGCVDLAVSNNKLYADNYTDIIVLDISDLNNVTEVDRVENVFSSNSLGFWFDYTADAVITGWEVIDTVYEFDCNEPMFYFDDAVAQGDLLNVPSEGAFFNANDIKGKAGSMARFALKGSQLYALNDYALHIFSIDNALELDNTFELEWGVETLFPYDQYLFVGANNGMHILDITDAVHPNWVSTYSHITSCDPVVVHNDIAYVTLRSGNECQNFTNQLEIIDVSDKSNPTWLKTYEMFNPHGLGVTYDNLLFLCDGEEGLKVYDNSDYMDLKLLQHYTGIHAYDVIPYYGNLLMIGSDGFYQYDYSNLSDIHQISYIPVVE